MSPRPGGETARHLAGRALAVVLCAALFLLAGFADPFQKLESGGEAEDLVALRASMSATGRGAGGGKEAIPDAKGATEVAQGDRQYPAPRRTTVSGRPVFWQMPFDGKAEAAAGEETPFHGVVLLLHGCNHRAEDWFIDQPSFACPECRGLPEERRIVQEVLAAGFAAVAISSSGRCWSFSDDVIAITRGLEEVYGAERLVPMQPRRSLEDAPLPPHVRHAPLFVLGASSGGSLASVLFWRLLLVPPTGGKEMLTGEEAKAVGWGKGTPLRVAAAVVEIASLALDHAMLANLPAPPPTMFAYMEKDKRTAAKVADDIQAIQKLGVDAVARPVAEERLTAAFFAERTRQTAHPLDMTQSNQIFESLRKAGLLDANGFLAADPRATKWRDVLVRDVPDLLQTDRLEADQSGIFELLNVAWGFHEMASAPMADALAFFKTHSPSGK